MKPLPWVYAGIILWLLAPLAFEFLPGKSLCLFSAYWTGVKEFVFCDFIKGFWKRE